MLVSGFSGGEFDFSTDDTSSDPSDYLFRHSFKANKFFFDEPRSNVMYILVIQKLRKVLVWYPRY